LAGVGLCDGSAYGCLIGLRVAQDLVELETQCSSSLIHRGAFWKEVASDELRMKRTRVEELLSICMTVWKLGLSLVVIN